MSIPGLYFALLALLTAALLGLMFLSTPMAGADEVSDGDLHVWSDAPDRLVVYWGDTTDDELYKAGFVDGEKYVVRWRKDVGSPWNYVDVEDNSSTSTDGVASPGDPDMVIKLPGTSSGDEMYEVELLRATDLEECKTDAEDASALTGCDKVGGVSKSTNDDRVSGEKRASNEGFWDRFGFKTMTALAAPSMQTTGTMYGTDVSSDSLYTVNTATGGYTLVGSTGTSNPAGLSWDGSTMYGSDFGSDSLYTVNTATGGYTLVGSTGTRGPVGLSWDGSTMYGSDFGSTSLYTVNTATGGYTLVGSTGTSSPAGLSWDGSTMYGSDAGSTSFYTVNTATGRYTLVGSTGRGDPRGLGWDGSTMYGADADSDSLYTVNTATGGYTLVGSTGTANARALAFIPPPLSSDASLSALSITPGTLSPTFSSSTYAYTASIDVTDITVSATANDADAAVSGNTGTLSLAVGTTLLTITVTAEDGTTQNYTISVTRAAPLSSDSRLSALSITPGALSPGFSSTTYAYTASIDSAVTSVTVAATANDADATVSGHTGTLNISVGATLLTITVTAEDGTTQDYTIVVTRAAPPALSSDSRLSALSITPGTLNPGFSSTTYAYTASVGTTVTLVTVSATTNHANATVSGTGASSVNVGANTLTVTVTAENGSTRDYTIVVTRAAALSSDSRLSALSITPGALSPTFSSFTYNYTASVGNTVTSVTIAATTNHANATVSGDTGASNVNVGSNTLTITVTAENGATRDYTITVTREDPPVHIALSDFDDDGLDVVMAAIILAEHNSDWWQRDRFGNPAVGTLIEGDLEGVAGGNIIRIFDLHGTGARMRLNLSSQTIDFSEWALTGGTCGDCTLYIAETIDNMVEIVLSENLDENLQGTSWMNLDVPLASRANIVAINSGDYFLIAFAKPAAAVNGPPAFASAAATRDVDEDAGVGDNVGAPLIATDPESDTITYSIDGDSHFSIVSNSGQIQVAEVLNYESATSHSVTVTATDSGGGTGDIAVTINVDNVDEAGTVFLSTYAPVQGAEVAATISDPDGGVTGTTWQWASSTFTAGPWADITGATSSAYTAVEEDRGKNLRATASYTDNEGAGKTARRHTFTPVPATVPDIPLSVIATAGNAQVALSWTAPHDGGNDIIRYEYSTDFNAWAGTNSTNASYTATDDSEGADLVNGTAYTFWVRAVNGVGTGGASASAAATPIGPPDAPTSLSATVAHTQVSLSWTAPSNDGGSEIIRYEYSSDDGASWSTTGGTSTSQTVSQTSDGSHTALVNGTSYTFRVRAVNGEGAGQASAGQTATPGNQPPTFADATATRSSAENVTAGSNLGTPVTATDDENDTLTYSVTGSNDVVINSASGQLSWAGGFSPDYETTSSYTLTVTAADVGGSDSITVTVNVTDENDAPSYSSTSESFNVNENVAAGSGIGTPVTATDEDNDTLTYSVTGAVDIVINTTSGQLSWAGGFSPDYETTSSYTLTVTATDPEGLSGNTTVTVTITDEDDAPYLLPNPTSLTPEANTNQEFSFTAHSGIENITFSRTNGTGSATVGTAEAGLSCTVETDSIDVAVSATVWIRWCSEGTITLTVANTDTLAETRSYLVNLGAANLAPDFGVDSLNDQVVSEDAAVGDDVLLITATDADGDALTWGLTGTGASDFRLTSSGLNQALFEVNAALDYETISSYDLTVTATDPEGLSDSVTITINIANVDEQPTLVPLPSAWSSVEPGIESATFGNVATITNVRIWEPDTNTQRLHFSSATSAVAACNNPARSLVAASGGTVWIRFCSVGASTIRLADDAVATDYREYAFTINSGLRAPGAPTSLVAQAGDAEAVLTWVAPTNNGGAAITDYEYNSFGGLGHATDSWRTLDTVRTNSIITQTSAAPYTDLVNGTSYIIRIRAVNSVGYGVQSNSATVSPEAATAPGAPTSLQVIPGNEQAVLSWTAPTENGGAAITEYQYSTDDGATWVDTNSTSVSHTVTGLSNGQSYDFRVRAVNSVGHGAQSDSDTATPFAQPGAPTNLNGSGGNGSVALSWTASDDGGAAILRYEYSSDDGSTWRSTGSTATSYTATQTSAATPVNLVNETAYTFRVRAVNSAGAGLASGSRTVSPTTNTTPGRVTGLAISPGNLFLDLSWDAPGNGGSAITRYEYMTTNDPWASTGSSGTTYHATTRSNGFGLGNGFIYSFRVRACNILGCGPESDTALGRPNNQPPAFAVTAANRSVNENESSGADVGAPITATDPEGDTISYQITGSNPGGFTVDSGGQIETGQELDRDTTASYVVNLRASATGGSDNVAVTITVNNVNETPSFASSNVPRSVPENSSGGTNVGAAVTADDPDAGDTLTYTLYNGQGLFTIVSTSGQIQVASGADLDYETATSYVLMVRATDSAGLYDETSVTVDITNVSETPGFASSSVSRSVPENSVGGTNVGAAVAATDPNGDTLTYTLYNSQGLFTVVSSSGQIQVASGADLDYETTASYVLTVRATDTGGLYVEASVTVDITNVAEFSLLSLAALNITLTTARLQASIVNGDGTPVTLYFRYRTPPNSGAWTAAGSDTTSGTTPGVDIAGLAVGTQYRAQTSLSNTFSSAQTTNFTTVANYATGIDITLSASTDAAFNVAFTNPTSATLNVYLRYGEVIGGSVPTWSSTVSNTESGVASTFTITGLTHGTEYAVDASLDNTFPDATTVSTDFTAGDAVDADTDFRVQFVEIIVTPRDPVPSSGSAVGFRMDIFGEVDPESISPFGALSEILAIEQTGRDFTLSINPCPSTWELHSIQIDELDSQGASTASTSVISLDYNCFDTTATWTARGLTLHTLGGTSSGGTTNDKGVTLRLHSLFIKTEQPGRDIGGHRRGTLKDTICALPEMMLGEGFCGPLMIFFPPLILIGVAFAFGVANPVALSAIGIVAFVGMAAIVMPGPIMVIGFIVAAMGAMALFALMRR